MYLGSFAGEGKKLYRDEFKEKHNFGKSKQIFKDIIFLTLFFIYIILVREESEDILGVQGTLLMLMADFFFI